MSSGWRHARAAFLALLAEVLLVLTFVTILLCWKRAQGSASGRQRVAFPLHIPLCWAEQGRGGRTEIWSGCLPSPLQLSSCSHWGANQPPETGHECQEAAGGHLFHLPPSEICLSPDLAIFWLRCASLPTVSSPTVRLSHDLRDVNSLDPSAPEH